MIRWHPLARAELHEAIDYLLHEASAAIARDFAARLEESLQLLQRHPMLGTPTSTHARRLSVRNFTYSLVYRIQDDHLHILALAHQRRRPGYWAKRR